MNSRLALAVRLSEGDRLAQSGEAGHLRGPANSEEEWGRILWEACWSGHSRGLARSIMEGSGHTGQNCLKLFRGQKAILRLRRGVCDEEEYDLVPHADKGSV